MFQKGVSQQEAAGIELEVLGDAIQSVSVQALRVLQGDEVDGLALSGWSLREGPNGDWCLTSRWMCPRDHPLAPEGTATVMAFLVAFHGGDSPLATLAKFLGECEAGTVRLYPDKFGAERFRQSAKVSQRKGKRSQ